MPLSLIEGNFMTACYYETIMPLTIIPWYNSKTNDNLQLLYLKYDKSRGVPPLSRNLKVLVRIEKIGLMSLNLLSNICAYVSGFKKVAWVRIRLTDV